MDTDDTADEGTGYRWSDALWRLGYRLAHRCLLVWWRLRRPRAEGAGVAVWHGGRLLVVRNSYRGTLLDLPGGGVATGETPRAAAARELREEVGIEIPPATLREVGRLGFTFEHRLIEETVFELCRPAAVATRPRPDRREVVWAGWLSPGELDLLPKAPGLRGYLALVEAGRAGEGTLAPDTMVQAGDMIMVCREARDMV